MAKDLAQIPEKKGTLKLGHIGTLNQCVKSLAKVIRAMANGHIDTQDGSRIANAIGIMRQCLETQELEAIKARLDALGTPGNQPQTIDGFAVSDRTGDRAALQ